MSERASTPPFFDPAALSEALHTAAHPTDDLPFGTGQRYDLPAGHLRLEVFPECRLSRITTRTARVELFASPPPQVVNGQIVFGREAAQEPRQTWQEDATLTVSPDGTVVFGYVHCPPAPEEATTAPETVQEPPDAAPATSQSNATGTFAVPSDVAGAASDAAGAGIRPLNSTGSPPDTPPPAVSQPNTTGTLTVQPEAAPANGGRPVDRQTKEQQPRVQLTGRLGRDPSFRTSPRGTLVGRFPLAVHQRDGTTVWHSVLAFGDRAQQLQHRSDAGELAKGREVNLIGYQHTREQPTREGGSKTVTEVYAVAVTRR